MRRHWHGYAGGVSRIPFGKLNAQSSVGGRVPLYDTCKGYSSKGFQFVCVSCAFFSISDDLILLARHTVPKKQNLLLGVIFLGCVLRYGLKHA